MDRPFIVEIINKAKEPIPEQIMKAIEKLRLQIETEYPGQKFKFVVDKLQDLKWNVQIQFDAPLKK